MKIIAVDPGYDRVGIAILNKNLIGGSGSPNVEQLVYSETFSTNKQDDINDRLFQVGHRIKELCWEYEVEYLAIEQLFFNSNQKTAMHVAEVRGIIMFAAHETGAKIVEFTPLQIKVAVAGNGRADKRSVIDMTRRLVQIPEGKRLDDEYDAIACGLCFFAHYRLQQ